MLTEIELAEVKKHFPAEAAATLTVENGLVKLCEKHLELSTLAVELDELSFGSPDQPRDDYGRWTESGGTAAGSKALQASHTSLYNGNARNTKLAAQHEAAGAKSTDLAKAEYHRAAAKAFKTGNAADHAAAGSAAHAAGLKHLGDMHASVAHHSFSFSTTEYNVDPEVAEMLAEGTQEKLKALVASGKITPAVQAKLELALVGPASARNVYALSRTASKTEKSLAAAVIEALAENTPPKLGEKTGAQVRELSRVVPDGKPETESKAVTETMVKMANGERVI